MEAKTHPNEPAIYLLDDDPDVLEAVSFLLEHEGLQVRAFERPSALRAAITPDTAGCLLLDVRLPEIDGLQLQDLLREDGIQMPVIFLSGHGDIPMAVQAVSAGALDFLEKPFRDDQLLEKINKGLAKDFSYRTERVERDSIEARVLTLTPREREVMEGMLEGKLNKVIAWELGVSTRTVEVHRAHIMDKMEARNSSDLVRMVLSTDTYQDWLI